MFVHRSNRSERLVDELAAVVRVPQRSAFAPELIAVQSKGMERWLALELSARLPVWANAEYPFPRRLLDRVFDAVLTEDPAARAPFAEHALSWSIAARIPQLLHEPAFGPIARYLQADGAPPRSAGADPLMDGARLLELATRLARVLDDYSVYRPELLRRWERAAPGDQDGGFEAVLWRALVRQHGRGDQAARAERCIAALRDGAVPAGKLPERLCLFGISSLPPLYLELLHALSEHVQTHLFLLSPSRAFFADVGRSGPESADGGHLLLGALGRIGRELQGLLEEHGNYREDDRSLYVEPGYDCLLHSLQSDLLELEDRGAPGGPPPLPIAPGDESIAIHVCHGPMREVEVLHDQLVALLQDPSLQPHQIVVLAPDIEVYAPVIEAVFGAHSGRPAIPFSLADRRTRSTHVLIDALFALLETLRGRMTAGSVLDLLGLDCIRERFGIAVEEVGRVREWVEETGVRWGLDAAHREAEGQPGFPHNTWRFGLDRLFLGLSLGSTTPALRGGAQSTARGHELYADTLPLDDVEGSDGELLGKLSALCEALFRERRALAAARDLGAWQADVERILSDFIAEQPDTAEQRALLRKTLAALRQDAELAGFTAAIDVRSLLAQLELRLDRHLPARGLLARGVTFCQLVPMRSIPFEVVCLLGMNDDSFPRPSAPLSFGRSGSHAADHGQRRRGDRSTRDDDRYMFLEALLCARRRLLISYVGRGIHDNRVRPPSVVVGDLLDAVAQGFVPAGSRPDAGASERRKAVVARLCCEHRLQAWSPRYFGEDPKLFSYAANACRAAQARSAPRSEPSAMGTVRLPPEAERASELTLDDLVRFIGAPVRHFAQRRLGLYLGDELTPPRAREPVELDPLERWQLRDELLQAGLCGESPDALLPALRAAGVLPLGTVGAIAYAKLRAVTDPLIDAVRAERRGEPLEPLAVSLDVAGMRLVGTLDALWSNARVEASASKPGRRMEIGLYVRHVVLNCQLARTPRPGYPTHSVLFAADGADVKPLRLLPPAAFEHVLERLIELWKCGRDAPLPFEYLVSRAYAEARFGRKAKSHEEALVDAERAFDDQTSPEGKSPPDEYVLKFFPRFADLVHARGGPGFVEVAAAVFEPFFGAQVKS